MSDMVPWSHLKDFLARLGHLPALGWPDDIDPSSCLFMYDGKKAHAVKHSVILVEWSAARREWLDLR